jgi:hypothetical protein
MNPSKANRSGSLASSTAAEMQTPHFMICNGTVTERCKSRLKHYTLRKAQARPGRAQIPPWKA